MTPLLIILISALAGARTWRLLAVDDIGRPFRDVYYRLFNRWYEWADALLTCPFCMGFWVTSAWLLAGLLTGGHIVWIFLAGCFAANFIGAQLNAWLDIAPMTDKSEIGDHE